MNTMLAPQQEMFAAPLEWRIVSADPMTAPCVEADFGAIAQEQALQVSRLKKVALALGAAAAGFSTLLFAGGNATAHEKAHVERPATVAAPTSVDTTVRQDCPVAPDAKARQRIIPVDVAFGFTTRERTKLDDIDRSSLLAKVAESYRCSTGGLVQLQFEQRGDFLLSDQTLQDCKNSSKDPSWAGNVINDIAGDAKEYTGDQSWQHTLAVTDLHSADCKLPVGGVDVEEKNTALVLGDFDSNVSTLAQAIKHELGHVLKLGHSNVIWFGSNGESGVEWYGDHSTIMGDVQHADFNDLDPFNALQLLALGVLRPHDFAFIDQPGNYRVDLDALQRYNGTAPRAIIVPARSQQVVDTLQKAELELHGERDVNIDSGLYYVVELSGASPTQTFPADTGISPPLLLDTDRHHIWRTNMTRVSVVTKTALLDALYGTRDFEGSFLMDQSSASMGDSGTGLRIDQLSTSTPAGDASGTARLQIAYKMPPADSNIVQLGDSARRWAPIAPN